MICSAVTLRKDEMQAQKFSKKILDENVEINTFTTSFERVTIVIDRFNFHLLFLTIRRFP